MIRTRFAPSPTGYVHMGSLRTALYCYLYAKQQKGHYVLRIEDTDQSRLVEDALENLIKELNWAGIHNDEGPVNREGKVVEIGENGPYTQSHRLPIYQEKAQELVDAGLAYYCFCSRERLEQLKKQQSFGYDRHCRDLDPEEAKRRVQAGESYVIRMKMPLDREIELDDLVRGKVKFNTKDSDDQVIQKADGFPTYHLAVVVDDHMMGITHALRGEEWLPSSPKHMMLYEYLGWEMPKFGHLPVIMNKATRRKLSKRDGDVYVSDFREKGYLPEALVNFIALVGWNPGDEQEIMSMEEMIERFSFERISRSSGVFDQDKLDFINNHYIRQADDKRLFDLLKPTMVPEFVSEKDYEINRDPFLALIALVKEKVKRVGELKDHILPFLQDEMHLAAEADEILKLEHMGALLDYFKKAFGELEVWDAEHLKATVKAGGKELGVKGKDLFMPLRIGVTGSPHGVDLIESMVLLGRERCVKRLEQVKRSL